MPIRRFDPSFSGLNPTDDKIHHIIPEEQRTRVGCPHSIEFWVAVRTVGQDGEAVVIQWCMRCRQVEVLTLAAYECRRHTHPDPAFDNSPRWWENE